MSDSLRPHGHQAPLSMGFSRQEYWSGCHFLLQGIFPTQGSNPGLPHCRQILYQLSHQGSPQVHLYMQIFFNTMCTMFRIQGWLSPGMQNQPWDWTICGFWCLQGVPEPMSPGCPGMTVFKKATKKYLLNSDSC